MRALEKSAERPLPPFAILSPARLLPALRDTRVLQLLDDVAGSAIVSSPVVAWHIETHGVVPVTARGIHDGILDRDYVVEFASGEIVAPGVGTWSTREAWLKGLGVGDLTDQLMLDLDVAMLD